MKQLVCGRSGSAHCAVRSTSCMSCVIDGKNDCSRTSMTWWWEESRLRSDSCFQRLAKDWAVLRLQRRTG